VSETRTYDGPTGHLTGITSSSTAAGTIQNLAYKQTRKPRRLAR
jgi:hypothetical protein